MTKPSDILWTLIFEGNDTSNWRFVATLNPTKTRTSPPSTFEGYYHKLTDFEKVKFLESYVELLEEEIRIIDQEDLWDDEWDDLLEEADGYDDDE